MKKFIAITVLMLGAMLAVAESDCPHGYHVVCPPPYWDVNGNQVIPECYKVCNQ
jgi:hypothetical protein